MGNTTPGPKPPTPASAGAATQSASVQPASGTPPVAENCPGTVCPKTAPMTWREFGSAMYDKHLKKFESWENYKADRDAWAAKSPAERMDAMRDLSLGRAGKAGPAMSAARPGKTPTPAPKPAPPAPAKPAPTGASPQPAAATPAAANGSGGGFSKGKARNEKGKCGEWLAKQDLHNDGYTDVIEVQNKSGHGVDVMGRNANGDVRVLEVKTTDGVTAPPLSKEQASMGGKDFADDRLGKAANAKGHYKNSPEAKANALKGQGWLNSAAEKGKKVSYEKYDVFIEDPKEGCIKKDAKSSPWDAKKPSSPKPPTGGRRK